MSDTLTAKTDAERLEEIEKFYHERRANEQLAIGCGDDREPHVDENIFGKEYDGMLRYYGGLVGIERVLRVTVAAQHGSKILETFNPNFLEGAKSTAKRIIKITEGKVVPMLHTADGNEGGATQYKPNAEGGVGCAYGAGAGAVTTLNSEPSIVAVGKEEQAKSFGDNTEVDTIAAANTEMGKYYFGEDPASYGLGRTEFNELGTDVMTLRGKHAPAKDTFVVVNYSPSQITNPNKANEEGKPFYNNDVTQVAELLLRAYPEFDLSPRLLLQVMDQDIRATRAALVAHETGEADPTQLAVVNRGDIEEAVAYLESVKQSL